MGNDALYGGSAADVLRGEGGNDYLYGNAGDDTLYGGSGNDILRGGDNNDLLLGGWGSDRLYGGSGHDLLDGGIDAANDRLEGGYGGDTFVRHFFPSPWPDSDPVQYDTIVDYDGIPFLAPGGEIWWDHLQYAYHGGNILTISSLGS